MHDADLLIVGGGPGGLAAALHARRQGLSVIVAEPRKTPVDKACGEGLMPGGLAVKQAGAAVAAIVDGNSSSYEATWRRITRDYRLLTHALVLTTASRAGRRAFRELARFPNRRTLLGDPTWLNLVRTVSVDFDEAVAEVVG